MWFDSTGSHVQQKEVCRAGYMEPCLEFLMRNLPQIMRRPAVPPLRLFVAGKTLFLSLEIGDLIPRCRTQCSLDKKIPGSITDCPREH